MSFTLKFNADDLSLFKNTKIQYSFEYVQSKVLN